MLFKKLSSKTSLLSKKQLAVLSSAVLAAIAAAQPAVTTYHFDNNRTGLNPNETILTPANVSPTTFGLLFADQVDGQVYAQPLYVPGVTIGGKVHNVVYVATEHNSVYAFDADKAGAPLWHVNEGPSVPSNDAFDGYTDMVPEIGITGTPVINETNGVGTIYLVAKTKELNSSNNYVYVQRLHALNIATGQEAITPVGASAPGPVIITATVKGTGEGTDGNGNVPFNPLWQAQRPALLLIQGYKSVQKSVVIGWASHGDANPYHGWIMTYNASTLSQQQVFNTTPNALNDPSGYPIAAGGVWMGGAGIASDGINLYLSTGNGTFDGTSAWGDSILKMSANLVVSSSFTPSGQLTLDDNDTDQGSGGVMLLPPSVGSSAHPNLLVQEGKDGNIYLCDVSSLGGYNATNGMVQDVSSGNGGIWGAPAYFNNNVYFGGEYSALQQFGISGATITANATANSSNSFSFPGTTPAVSANGTTNGIVWAVDSGNYGTTNGQENLYAYDATNLNTLYSTANVAGRDNFGTSVKFITPIITNGKVYVGSGNSIAVFGLRTYNATPTSSVASGSFTSSFQVQLSDTSPGAKIYYTLDGTIPNTYSYLYTKPFTISANATLVVKAASATEGPSEPNYYFYSFPPLVSGGNGLTGKYYNGTETPSGTPTVTEVDPTINFNWGGNSPVTGVGGSNWSAEWTGYIIPQYTAQYNIVLTGDDGIRLWLNGREVINGWVDQGATAYSSGRYSLIAGHKYPIKIDYFQDQGGSVCQLQWQTLGTQLVVVPQSQLSTN